jgi:hypothetical protein
MCQLLHALVDLLQEAIGSVCPLDLASPAGERAGAGYLWLAIATKSAEFWKVRHLPLSGKAHLEINLCTTFASIFILYHYCAIC